MSWGKVAFLGAIIAVALTAYAVGAGSKSSKTVVLCAAKDSGKLTLAGHGKCAKGEKKISVAKQGPRGPAGPAGPAGPQGAAGASATSTLEAPHLVSAANTACAVQTGSFCVSETGLCFNNGNFGNGQAPASFRKDSDGYVHLEGSFKNSNPEGACGSEPTRPAFYLPQGFRPSGGSERFAVAPCEGEAGESGNAFITVGTNGRVGAGSSTSACFNLNGIVFHGDA